MFYSNQLLARKAPLGQIWRAATLHAKINRRNLNKLNIINICEEILNPSVPMALRLSGILMGGVVIVYERKVKLLYEDVTRFLVEINEAWKVKAKRDTTILPKGKSQAKYEAVTLPDNQPTELGDIEQLLQFSNSQTLIGIHNKMNLDNIDDSYINPNIGEADLPHDHHQADIENITIPDPFDSHQTDARYFNKYERFDIEGDEIEGNEETQENFPSENHTLVPSPPLQENFPSENHTRVPSPPLQDEPQNSNEIHEQSKADHTSHHSEHKAQRIPRRQKPSRKRTKKTVTMDYEHTMIPGQMYQSWLQDASDIVSRRGRKRKHSSSMKIGKLMDLPPVAIMDSLFTDGNKDVYYPQPLLKQWMILTQPVQDVPPRETSPPHPPAPSSHSPPETNNYHDQTTFPFEDHHSGAGSESVGLSVEKQRLDVNNHEMPEIPSGILNNGVSVTGGNEGPVREADVAVTPANSGGQLKSLSSESGPGFLPVVSDINSIRSHKKRLFSSGRRSGSSLEPVAEDFAFNQNDPIFEVRLSPEAETNDLILETGPTQTQKAPLPDQPMEQLTDSIRRQLKTYFDTPGSAQTESLNQLAYGLDRKKAACLFYQTCVLATRNIIRVQQTKPYGDIAISRGAKM